jgi:hypothetical protein
MTTGVLVEQLLESVEVLVLVPFKYVEIVDPVLDTAK